MNTRIFIFVAFLTFTSVTLARAQSPSQFQVARDATVDLAVPESPAFAALGLTPQEVTRPSSGRELATALLNGVDRDGHFQTGIAIDTAPYMLLAGSKLTLKTYREGPYLTRFFAQWQTSFATTKGTDADDESAKIAIGMRFTLFDRGDPRMDDVLLKCLSDAAEFVFNTSPPVPPGTDVDIVNRERETKVRAAAKPCRDASAKRRWNRSAWIVGVAPTWTSPNGKAGNMEYTGAALWTSIGHGFEGVPVLEDHALIAGYLKYRDQEIAPDPFKKGAFVTQDNFAAGGRMMVGEPFTQINFEGIYVRNNRDDNLRDRFWRVNLGFERRLADHIWLVLSFGRELERRGADDSMFVLGTFKWGLGEK